jgi:DNA topoisomerase-3
LFLARATLTERERVVYELIARRYVAQFYPSHAYLQTQLELRVAGEMFWATGRQVLTPGWRTLFSEASDDDARRDPSDDASEPESRSPLPRLAVGASVVASDVVVDDQRTRPPKPFTDASLMAAMCGVAAYVADPRAKKLLTETDGIGTPATRAAIIETLFARGYAERTRKTIVSTATGRALIAALPLVATTPDMTAVWEAAMRGIHDGQQSLEAFVACISSELGALVHHGKGLGSIAVPQTPRSANSTPRARQRVRGKFKVRSHAT